MVVSTEKISAPPHVVASGPEPRLPSPFLDDNRRGESAPLDPESLVGITLGSHVLEGLIGEGGMGWVFRARHRRIGSVAAIKVLVPELSQSPNLLDRFYREAVLTGKIRSPAVTRVYDFDADASTGLSYLLMELLEGESLLQRLVLGGRMSVPLAIAIGRQLAAALEAAHACDVVHRDLKPSNVFLVPDLLVSCGVRVKVLDFGIAKALADDPVDLELTGAGTVLGTPSYMSPEQLAGTHEVAEASDIFSLGCILFRMISGAPPMKAAGLGEYILAYQSGALPRLSGRVDVPAALDLFVDSLLSLEPSRRPSAAEAHAALSCLANNPMDQPTDRPELATRIGYPAPQQQFLRGAEITFTEVSNSPPQPEGSGGALSQLLETLPPEPGAVAPRRSPRRAPTPFPPLQRATTESVVGGRADRSRMRKVATIGASLTVTVVLALAIGWSLDGNAHRTAPANAPVTERPASAPPEPAVAPSSDPFIDQSASPRDESGKEEQEEEEAPPTSKTDTETKRPAPRKLRRAREPTRPRNASDPMERM